MARSIWRARPTAFAVGLALVAWLTFAATVPSQAQSLTTVRVAFRPLQTWGPLFIAEKEGLFAKQGIRIEWIPQSGGGRAMATLISGEIHVGPEAASAAFFNAVARGESVRIVADKGYVAPGSAVFSSLVIRKDLMGTAIKSVSDLKGRRIALNATGSTSHYILAKILTSAGLRFTDVDIHRLPTEAMVAAMASRGIDAVMIPEPWVTQLKDRGLGVLFKASGDVVPNEQIAFVFYGPDLLQRDRPLGQRFMRAYVEGLRQYSRGPTARNVSIVSGYTELPDDVIRKGGWITMFADGHIEVERLRRFQDWLYEISMIEVRNPIQATIDGSFIERANAALR
jgi:ABC-type nitrate/sulfonate/bicarbonate transport system substrate-binding protein